MPAYTKYDFSTAITSDKTLYPHYLAATVKINGFVRTDADGTKNDDGAYYRMPNLSVTGFDTGAESIKYVIFNGGNVDSITALNQVENEITFDAASGILTFTPAVSMTEARDYVRNNIVVEPSKNNDNTHKDGSMNVMVVDKNGTAGVGSG